MNFTLLNSDGNWLLILLQVIKKNYNKGYAKFTLLTELFQQQNEFKTEFKST